METWRLILDPPLNGPLNMATDQAIMESVGAGKAPPTLRFYDWQPPCLSLGYGQRSREADVQRLRKHGWDIVRRATGGKAILHTDELTYSVTLPKASPLVAGDIVESYRRLSAALLAGLIRLDVAAQSTPIEQAGKATGPVCFEVPSNYEITVAGRKLVGSAQVRRYNAVLQHGSIPLTGDITRICEALAFFDDEERANAKERVRTRAITVEQALGKLVSWQMAAQAMAEAFADTFDLDLCLDTLADEEIMRRDEAYHHCYAHDDWTFRR